MINLKSGKYLASNGLSKADMRYWLARVFKPRTTKAGSVYETAFYFARFQHAGRRSTSSLGTANQTLAATRAKERYLFLKSNGWSAFLAKYHPDEQSEQTPIKSNITVGDYLAAVEAESDLSPATFKPYAQRLRQIVADNAGIRPSKKRFDYRKGGNRAWLAKVHQIRLAEVTPRKVEEWKKKFIAAAGSDVIARRRATVSCNSILRQARALFSKRNVLSKLHSVELPPVLPFDGVSVERRTDMKFYGCGVEPMALLRDAVAELGAAKTEELKAFLLALVLGLRRKEADLLEWQSFDFGAGTLRMMPTKWYALKTDESASVLPVEPEILALFRGWHAKARSEFVIESERPPKAVSYQWYRCDAVFENLLTWLRGKGVHGQKPIHALRKLYGSALVDRHGLHAASSGLRHADLRTTSEFYADRTVKLTAGFGAALSSEGGRIVSFPSSPSVSKPRRRR
jgi:integrase